MYIYSQDSHDENSLKLKCNQISFVFSFYLQYLMDQPLVLARVRCYAWADWVWVWFFFSTLRLSEYIHLYHGFSLLPWILAFFFFGFFVLSALAYIVFVLFRFGSGFLQGG